MKDFEKLEDWSPKELRKLRMNLNNRLESFKSNPDAKELPPSHMLHGLGHGDCDKLLIEVKQAEKKQAQASYEKEDDDE